LLRKFNCHIGGRDEKEAAALELRPMLMYELMMSQRANMYAQWLHINTKVPRIEQWRELDLTNNVKSMIEGSELLGAIRA